MPFSRITVVVSHLDPRTIGLTAVPGISFILGWDLTQAERDACISIVLMGVSCQVCQSRSLQSSRLGKTDDRFSPPPVDAQRYLLTHVPCFPVHTSQEMETASMSISQHKDDEKRGTFKHQHSFVVAVAVLKQFLTI